MSRFELYLLAALSFIMIMLLAYGAFIVYRDVQEFAAQKQGIDQALVQLDKSINHLETVLEGRQ
jgi:hypothetical protein